MFNFFKKLVSKGSVKNVLGQFREHDSYWKKHHPDSYDEDTSIANFIFEHGAILLDSPIPLSDVLHVMGLPEKHRDLVAENIHTSIFHHLSAKGEYDPDFDAKIEKFHIIVFGSLDH